MPTMPTVRFPKLRRPEYTGENRCTPCTIVNAVITATLASAFWLFVDPVAGVAVVLFGAAVIWLRGYLVPGTPELTKRYLPDRVLRYFDHHSNSSTASGTERQGIDALTLLTEAGVVYDDDELDDLALVPEFETAWAVRMQTVGRDVSEQVSLARLADVDPERVHIQQMGPALVARIDGFWVGQWESHAAFVADIAAGEELETRHPRWDTLSPRDRNELIGALRLFVTRCPTCDGDVLLGSDVVESCCRRYDVLAATCEACDSRLLELELTGEFEAALTG